MPTDIPALIERLAVPLPHLVLLGPVDGHSPRVAPGGMGFCTCIAEQANAERADAATALAEQAGEIEQTRGRFSHLADEAAKRRDRNRKLAKRYESIKQEIATLRRQLAEAREVPTQPVALDDKGVARFKQNAIVRFLLDAGPFDMNRLAVVPFSDEDRMQFAQLIGYSVGGYEELSYVSDESADRARQWLASTEKQ